MVKTATEVESNLLKIEINFLKQQASISLKEADDLLSEAKKEVESIRGEEVTEKIQEVTMKIFFRTIGVGVRFAKNWEEGNFSPTDEELNIMEKLASDSGKVSDEEFVKYRGFNEEDISQLRNEMKKLETKIQEEIIHRQNDSGGGNNSPLPSDNSEINKRISSLQSQIDSLEQKQSQNPNSNDSEQTKQELTRLRSELAALKTKQNQQNDKNPQPNGFPWGLFVGGGDYRDIIDSNCLFI